MDFTLTGEQLIIRDTARNLFARECPRGLLARAWDDPGAAAPLWRDHLADWVGLAEQPLADAAVFLEEHGRAAAPGVFLPSLLAAYVAQAAGLTCGGAASVAVSGPAGLWRPHAAPLKHFVPCAAQADALVVVGGEAAAPRVAIVPATAVVATAVDNLDRLRPLYTVTVSGGIAGTQVGIAQWQQAQRRCLVAVSAELVGVGRALLDSAVAYAGERRQFGRPIGAFQGLQWQLVDAAVALERAAAAVTWAALCVDADDGDAPVASHTAKLEAGSAARHCARTALQVHGGIGYTWEHGLHYWLRRAYAGDGFMGPADYHAGCLAAELFAA